MVAKKKAKKAKKATTTRKKKKPATKEATAKTWQIEYRCDGGCIADPEELHVEKGDTVVMNAVGTDVDITFRRSPFKNKSFSIAQGSSVSEKVTNDSGRFPYLLECDNCPVLALPPRIIID